MKTKLLFYTLAAGIAVGITQSAWAEEHHHKRTEALTDEVFAKEAAAGGLTEVELGKLAQQNGNSQEVKDFGSHMVTDHSKANDNLKAVAAKNNLTIPDKPNAEQQEMIDKLAKESGAQFDKDYIHAMVKDHTEDKELFTEAVDTAKNPDLKQFAQDTLEIVKHHLGMIDGIAQARGMGRHGDETAAGNSQGKSGVGPGANGSDANRNSPDTTIGIHTGQGVGTSSESKSGVGPGGNGDSAPNR